jgi:hypothetical protein
MARPRWRPHRNGVADTLYVIGGLYGNRPALARWKRWPPPSPARSRCVSTAISTGSTSMTPPLSRSTSGCCAMTALLGNVEAELLVEDEEAGCGCAYPSTVDAGVVERSNRIHARLKATARRHPEALAGLRELPRVCPISGGRRAGRSGAWRCRGAGRLAVRRERAGRSGEPDVAGGGVPGSGVEVFASSHTCLPVCRRFEFGDRAGWVINNGSAGMANFADTRFGVVTRIGASPSPHPRLYGGTLGGVHIDALALEFDADRWEREFLANWPPESPAHVSYFARIRHGPAHEPASAAPRAS